MQDKEGRGSQGGAIRRRGWSLKNSDGQEDHLSCWPGLGSDPSRVRESEEALGTIWESSKKVGTLQTLPTCWAWWEMEK